MRCAFANTSMYDLAGNMVCRAPTSATLCGVQNTTGAQLRYDAEERLASWQNAPSNPTTTVTYLYDGAGQRVAQQVTASGTTTTTAYVGDIEEVATSGASTTTTTYYYAVGQRIALAVNGDFSYLASDGLGSANVAFDANGDPTATALYRPYGTPRYASGQMPGSEGFTGQHTDAAVTGLDYYGARYYDPAGAVFTQPDSIGDGPNPYAYTGGNPETFSDPSGHKRTDGQPGGHDYWTPEMLYAYLYDKAMDGALGADGNSMALWLFLTDKLLYSEIVEWEGETYGTINFQTMMVQDAWKVNDAHTGNYWNEADHRQERMALEPALFMAAEMASGRSDDLAPGMASMGDPDGAGIFPDEGGFDGVDEGDDVAVNRATDGMDGEACSFSANTPVATPSGEQAIGSLTVGETVEAYNPRTGQAEAEPVQHVWVNHDSDLVDVRVAAHTAHETNATTTAHAQASGHGLVVGDSTRAAVHLAGNQYTANADAGETIHTTANHPWLTADRGWVAAGNLRAGEPLVTLNGATGIVLWVRATPGVADRYNLTVTQDHTYAVGAGQWVVHNTDCGSTGPDQGPTGPGGSGSASTPTGGTKIVVTPQGHAVSVPDNWPSRVANNGQGIVFQEPGAVGDANEVRIMDPTMQYPEGYLRYYNSYGQPLDAFGKPGPRPATHLSLDTVGGASGYYTWLKGFIP